MPFISRKYVSLLWLNVLKCSYFVVVDAIKGGACFHRKFLSSGATFLLGATSSACSSSIRWWAPLKTGFYWLQGSGWPSWVLQTQQNQLKAGRDGIVYSCELMTDMHGSFPSKPPFFPCWATELVSGWRNRKINISDYVMFQVLF